jgi:hypothetical protein
MAAGLAALATAVDDAVGVPVDGLCAAELQGRIPAVAQQRDRLDGWLSAASGQLQAATGGKVATDGGGERPLPGWLAEATRTSSGAAGARLRTSAALRDLPLIVQAVLDGIVSQENAAILARLVGQIPLGHLQEVQQDLILVATGRDPVQLAAWVRHEIATHVEPALEHDEAAAHDKRYLQTSRGTDGSVKGRFSLAPGDAEPFLTVLEAGSRRQGDQDRRSAGQRRADALSEMAEQVLRHRDLPDHGGQRPQISYVLPADWAARQSDRAACPTCTSCPAHRPTSFADTVAAALPGQPGVPAEWSCATAAWTGPATRTRIETLLCDARISRVLLDDVGQVTGLETLRDTVTPAQRRSLAARDGRCTARGCTRPPAMCDAHHLLGLADGGPTALGNLVLLCRRHHVLWHLGKLRLIDLHVPWHPDARPTGADPPLASAP